jgi:site-specific DNA recombinase
MTTRAAAYARVSTDAQAEKKTIANQLHEIREWAAKNDVELVAEFADDGISGVTPFEDRPEAQQLLEMALTGAFDCTVIYCVYRIGRDVVEAVEADRLRYQSADRSNVRIQGDQS